MTNGLSWAKGPLKTQKPSHRCHGRTLTTAGTLVSGVKKLKTKGELVCHVLELQWRQKSLQAVKGGQPGGLY